MLDTLGLTLILFVMMMTTVMILSFRTDMPGQTVQTQIRLLIRVYTVCYSVCIVLTHYSMVKPHSSNFGVITTNFFGVRIFRKFTVTCTIVWNSWQHVDKDAEFCFSKTLLISTYCSYIKLPNAFSLSFIVLRV